LGRPKQSSSSKSAQRSSAAATRHLNDDVMVQKSLYDEKQHELLAKDETIQVCRISTDLHIHLTLSQMILVFDYRKVPLG